MIIHNLSIPYCSSNMEKLPILLENLCGPHPNEIQKENSTVEIWLKARVPSEQKPANPKGDYIIYLGVYSKLEHRVMGTGYKCKISYTLWIFSENFWTTRFRSSEEHQPDLSDFDCWRMVRDKLCRNTFHGTTNQMSSNNTSCEFKEPLIETYGWNNDIRRAQVKCSYTKTEIIADDEENFVYGLPCKA